MMAPSPTEITDAVLGLDRWFDAMRVDWPTPGYGGPVVHWWNHCLAYQGAGLDWRYEGIIAGYLTLWERTGGRHWLNKAIRAGDDLAVGQLPDGSFVSSQFEANPGSKGTPHELASSVGLLLLAKSLAEVDSDAANLYLRCAQTNIERFAFGRLWNPQTQTLTDREGTETFVPNKAATFIEAVLLLSELTGEPEVLEKYAFPTAEKILSLQNLDPSSPTYGGIAQNELNGRVVYSYFPLYVARCVPALIALSGVSGDARYRDGAQLAVHFLLRVRDADGGFPQVAYGNGKTAPFPRWIAGAGDIVRAFDVAAQIEPQVDYSSTLKFILRGRREDGRIVSAEGFERILPLVSRRDRGIDELGVVGWCDKAFRVLTKKINRAMIDSNLTAPIPTRLVPNLVTR